MQLAERLGFEPRPGDCEQLVLDVDNEGRSQEEKRGKGKCSPCLFEDKGKVLARTSGCS